LLAANFSTEIIGTLVAIYGAWEYALWMWCYALYGSWSVMWSRCWSIGCCGQEKLSGLPSRQEKNFLWLVRNATRVTTSYRLPEAGPLEIALKVAL
jgi:hypothetical protein